jgi:hypothetical protein
MGPPTREEIFRRHEYPLGDKLKNFEKFVGHMDLARFLARHALFQRVLGVKGSIVECGVRHGGGLFAWAKLSAIFEPYGFNRRILGFDTFEGFPHTGAADRASAGARNPNLHTGGFALPYDVQGELQELLEDHDRGRLLAQFRKVELVKGDATQTIPAYLETNRHLLVALLFLDFDLYEPTRAALLGFLPRMPKGAVIAFDELNSPDWPGETAAVLEHFDLRELRLEKLPYEPNIAFAVL